MIDRVRLFMDRRELRCTLPLLARLICRFLIGPLSTGAKVLIKNKQSRH